MKMDTRELLLNLEDKKPQSDHGNMLSYSESSFTKATSIRCVCTACYENNSLMLQVPSQQFYRIKVRTLSQPTQNSILLFNNVLVECVF